MSPGIASAVPNEVSGFKLYIEMAIQVPKKLAFVRWPAAAPCRPHRDHEPVK